MKKLCFLLITLFTINCYSQINFEKGYYIDNANQKTECLIRNVDWKNNPTSFEYKKSEKSETKTTNIQNIKEFGIYNNSKFIRNTVKIDRSSESIQQLSKERNPIFKEEQLFLKVLIEGKSNLFVYSDVGLIRYFYQKDGSNIQQLVFKKYATADNNIKTNNYFKQQLRKDLKCDAITLKKIENLAYKKNSLVNLFTLYNNCSNSNSVSYIEKQKKDLFNLTLRPRLNSSTLKFQNNFSPFLNVDFGSKLGFGFGIEAEFILPFNKNKWAIAIEPTYQSFKSEKVNNSIDVTTGPLIKTKSINYSSIELPISFRHYFFLNNNAKIFVNASYVLDLPLKSSTEYRRVDDTLFFSYNERASQSNYALGLGYKLDDKYSFEMRYQTSREVIDGNRNGQRSNYNTVSIIVGYSIF